MFNNIVVATDGSDSANRALTVACDLAKHYGGALHLVHAPQLETHAIAVGATAVAVAPTQEEVQQAGKSVMEDATAAAEFLGISPASATIGNGSPATEVIAAIDRTHADLVVAGRRGLGGMGSLFLGSTSQKISHDAPCAVLTVK